MAWEQEPRLKEHSSDWRFGCSAPLGSARRRSAVEQRAGRGSGSAELRRRARTHTHAPGLTEFSSWRAHRWVHPDSNLWQTWDKLLSLCIGGRGGRGGGAERRFYARRESARSVFNWCVKVERKVCVLLCWTCEVVCPCWLFPCTCPQLPGSPLEEPGERSWKFTSTRTNFSFGTNLASESPRTGSWPRAGSSPTPPPTSWRSGRRRGRKCGPRCWGTSRQPPGLRWAPARGTTAASPPELCRAPSSPTTATRSEAPPPGTASPPPTRWLGPPPARLWGDPRRTQCTSPLSPQPRRPSTRRRPRLSRRKLRAPPRTPAPRWRATTATRRAPHPGRARRRRAAAPAPGRARGRSRRGSCGRRGDPQGWSACRPPRWVHVHRWDPGPILRSCPRPRSHPEVLSQTQVPSWGPVTDPGPILRSCPRPRSQPEVLSQTQVPSWGPVLDPGPILRSCHRPRSHPEVLSQTQGQSQSCFWRVEPNTETDLWS